MIFEPDFVHEHVNCYGVRVKRLAPGWMLFRSKVAYRFGLVPTLVRPLTVQFDGVESTRGLVK